jgi:hypothetical protein
MVIRQFQLEDKAAVISLWQQPEGLPEGSRGLSEAIPPEHVLDSKHPERVQEFPNPCFCDPSRVVFVLRTNRGFPLRSNPRLPSDKPSACGKLGLIVCQKHKAHKKIKTRIAAGFVFENNIPAKLHAIASSAPVLSPNLSVLTPMRLSSET